MGESRLGENKDLLEGGLGVGAQDGKESGGQGVGAWVCGGEGSHHLSHDRGGGETLSGTRPWRPLEPPRAFLQTAVCAGGRKSSPLGCGGLWPCLSPCCFFLDRVYIYIVVFASSPWWKHSDWVFITHKGCPFIVSSCVLHSAVDKEMSKKPFSWSIWGRELSALSDVSVQLSQVTRL